MRITATEEYGLRCLLVLAHKGTDGQCSIADVAEKEGLSVPYASKLLSILRKAGLVSSVRGRTGGFAIARAADQINLLDVITALGGPLMDPDHCNRFSGQLAECVHTDDCSVHHVLGSLAGSVAGFLSSTTLQDLLDGTHKSMQFTRTGRDIDEQTEAINAALDMCDSVQNTVPGKHQFQTKG
ncbi:MAG: RrF2 family transcriptional regulator [Candidatus Zixiibacteriota bacterium]